MPNWVMNKVKFKSRGKEILDKVITIRNEDKEEFYEDDIQFDFNKIIPRPKTLNITSGGYDTTSMQYALLKMETSKLKETIEKLTEIPTSYYGNYFRKVYHIKKYTLDELEEYAKRFEKELKKTTKDIDDIDYKSLGVKNFEDLGNLYIDNIIRYKADSWYDWSCENWGTKWNSARTYRVSDNEVEFETAWNCPINIFKELSKQFKNVEIEVSFADEDMGYNCGYFTMLNGDFVEFTDMNGNRNFALNVWGYEEDFLEEEV